MSTVKEHQISNETGRLDKVLSEIFPKYSRSQIERWITDQKVLVNQQATNKKYSVKSGDLIELTISKPKATELIPEDIPLDIIYEDEDIIVVNKPQGMVVHPSPGHESHTLVNALLYHAPSMAIGDDLRPGIVHRIDKDTSGLLMVAKNNQAMKHLQEDLKAQKNRREYLAIVYGNISEDSGTINAPLGRDPKNRQRQSVIADGRPARTHFEVLERFGNYTLLKLRLETGRTHQIRVHMAYIQHPVVGDPLYGPKKVEGQTGQYLHAQTLGLTLPSTGEEKVFTVEPPENFQKFLNRLHASQK